MKCPNCNCEVFYKDTLMTGGYCTEGGAWKPIEVHGCPVDAYICKNCGRIEFYSLEALKKHVAEDERKAKEETFIKAKEEKKAKLLSEKKELSLIVNDENQTIKRVKEAQERLKKIESELQYLEYLKLQ